MGWGYSYKFTFNPKLKSVKILTAGVYLDDGKNYSPSYGPHIYKEKKPSKASLISTVSYNSVEKIVLIPEISIYKWPKREGAEVTFLKGESVLLDSSNKEATLTIDLPNFDYLPGVYEGFLHIKDDKGNIRASEIPFRYIVAGDIITIHSMSSEKTSVAEDEKFSVKVFATGSPVDMDNYDPNIKYSQDVVASLFVKNEKGQIVAKGTKDVSLISVPDINFDFISKKRAKALKAEVIFTKNGKEVARHVSNLSADYDLVVSELSFVDKYKVYLFIIIGILVAVLTVFFRKKILIKNNLVIWGSILISSLLISGAQAIIITEQGSARPVGEPAINLNITLNSPQEEQSFNPGESFNVSGNIFSPHCTNSSENIYISTWISNQAGTVNISSPIESYLTRYNKNGTHDWSVKNTEFPNGATGPLVNLGAYNLRAPGDYGNYRLYVKARQDFRDGIFRNSNDIVTKGYVNFKVIPISPTGFTLTGGVSCSPNIALSWTKPTNMTGVEGFKLYRSTSQNGTYDLVATLPITATSYTDTLSSLVPGTFYYKITAYDSESGLESDPVSTSYTYADACIKGECKTPPHNTQVGSAPRQDSDSLCTIGLFSQFETERSLSGATTYTWKCTGTNVSQVASCSAELSSNVVDGECGTKHGSVGLDRNYSFTAGELCSRTSVIPVNPSVSTDDLYQWICTGSGDGQSRSCNASVAITQSPVCGTLTQFSDWPVDETGLCGFGSVIDRSFNSTTGRFYWSCEDAASNVSNQCTATKVTPPVDGACGTKHMKTDLGTGYTFSEPELCARGVSTPNNPTVLSGHYNWSCSGTNGGVPASCRATVASLPPSTPTVISAIGQCNGTNDQNIINLHFDATQGSQPVTANVYRSTSLGGVYAKIGSGIMMLTEDTGRLSGVFSDTNAVRGATYYYKVELQNSTGKSPMSGARSATSPARCTDEIGICGNAINNMLYFTPNTNILPSALCQVGNPIILGLNETGTKYRWRCAGSDGDAICELSKAESNDAECGLASGAVFDITPGSTRGDLCNPGQASVPIIDPEDSSKYKWTCTSANGLVQRICRSSAVINGVCGTKGSFPNNENLSPNALFTTNELCSVGTPSTNAPIASALGRYSWTCEASGVDAPCDAFVGECSGDCNDDEEEDNDGDDGGSLCGSKNGSSFSSIPNDDTTGLCSGASSVVPGSISSDAGGYYWNCKKGSSPTVSCHASYSGGVSIPPGGGTGCNGICPPPENGSVELRQFKAFPSLVTSGGVCAIRLDQNIFEKANLNTRCTLKLPSGNSYYKNGASTFSPVIDDGAGGFNYMDEFISQGVFRGSSYGLTCYQVNPSTGVMESGSEKKINALCRINPALIETSFVDKFYGGVKNMTASLFDAVYRFFNLR